MLAELLVNPSCQKGEIKIYFADIFFIPFCRVRVAFCWTPQRSTCTCNVSMAYTVRGDTDLVGRLSGKGHTEKRPYMNVRTLW